MIIQTKYHGEVDVQESEALYFERGIPGFPEEKSFYVLPLSEDGIFLILQSAVSSSIAFIIVNPFYFFKDYDFILEDTVQKGLGLITAEAVSVYTILTVEEPFNHTTANLQAPLIINRDNNKGKQVILNDLKYHTKHRIFPEKG
jgi:flagellar assembly factor FliW